MKIDSTPEAAARLGGGARRFAGGTARIGTSLLLGFVGFGLGLVVILLLAGGALIWRLNQGPLEITAYAQRLEAEFAPGITSERIVLAMGRAGGVHVLRLDVVGIGRAAAEGREAQSVRSATLVLPLRRLLGLDVVPTTLVADGVRLQVTRAAPGRDAGGEREGFDLRRLDGLQSVSLTDVQIAVVDNALGATWRVDDAALDLHRQEDGSVAGRLEANLSAGDVATHLVVTGTGGDAGAHLAASTTALSPAALARVLPGAARLAALDAAITVQATGDFGREMQLEHGSVHAESGPGTALIPAKGGTTSPGQFAAMSLDASFTPREVTIQTVRLVLAPPSGNPPSNLVLSGTVQIGSRIRAQLALDVDQAALSDVGALWPERVGGGSRPWLVQNLTAGTAHDGHFTFTLQSDASGGDVALVAAGGQMVGDDVTVWWLRPVPPLEHGHAVLSLLDPDTMLITASGARTGNIVLRGGTMRITGLSVHDQVSVLNGDFTGPLPDLLTMLANPRLGLLSKRPFRATNPAGTVVSHLTVHMPLENKLTIEQVAIHATGSVTDAHLGAIAAGRDLDHGRVTMDVTNDGLHAEGTALLDQLPSTLQVDMDFRDGPPSQVLEHVIAAAQVTPAAARAAGLQVIGLDAGVIPATLDYAERRDSTAAIAVDADLTAAAIDTPIGWSKPAGAAGHAGGRALLDHSRLVGLEGIHADGPGLSIAARSELVNGQVSVVHIERGIIGRSSATGTIALPQTDGLPYRVTLAGPRLDLEGRLNSQSMSSSSQAASPGSQAASPSSQAASPRGAGAPYIVDLRFERVGFGAGHAVGPVVVTASGTGSRLVSGHLSSRGPELLEADLSPGQQERRLRVTAGDLGTLLRQTELATELEGGAMTLSGAFDDRVPSSPLNATLELTNFRVRGAPIGGKVLQALTVYGVPDALNGPGLAFDRMVAPFRIDGSVLSVNDMRAFTSSLGVTATGSFDFGHQTMDLAGTIVPAYALNSLPGRVPLLGRLFSPEKGSGVFAATYGLHGPVSDPAFSINPLSALTPGFLRGVFDLFR